MGTFSWQLQELRCITYSHRSFNIISKHLFLSRQAWQVSLVGSGEAQPLPDAKVLSTQEAGQAPVGQPTWAWASSRRSYRVYTSLKQQTASAGDAGHVGLIPESGRSPGGGNGNPLEYSWLENSTDRGAWWATVHGGHKESDTTEQLSTQSHSQ